MSASHTVSGKGAQAPGSEGSSTPRVDIQSRPVRDLSSKNELLHVGAGNESFNVLEVTKTQIKGINGTAAAPGYSFIDDPDTGIFRAGTNSISIATNGIFRLNVNAAGLVAMTGALSVASTSLLTGIATFTAQSVHNSGIDCNGNINVSGTSLVTGIGTFTAQSVHNGGIDCNGNINISGTSLVTGIGTFTAQSVHNGGIDCNGNADISGNLLVVGQVSASSLDIVGNIDADGTLDILQTSILRGVATFSVAPIFNSTTANEILQVNGSKQLVSAAITGGNAVVKADAPSVTGVWTHTGNIAFSNSGNALIDLHSNNSSNPVSMTIKGNGTSNTTFIGVESSAGTGIFGTGEAFGTVFGTSTAHPVSLWSNNSQTIRMVSGKLFVPSFTNRSSANSTQVYYKFNATGGDIHELHYDIPSSVRYKENIKDYDLGAEKMLDIKIKQYDYRKSYVDDPKNRVSEHMDRMNHHGVIADEVHKLLPDLVSCDPDGRPERTHLTRVDFYFLELAQKQQKQIDQLKKEVKRLSS